jgi:hypothetical protein
MDTKDIVLQTMQKAGKALRPGELAEMAGVEKKDVEKAIKALNTEGKVFSPVRCFWQAK